jgi:hypothetical protein
VGIAIQTPQLSLLITLINSLKIYSAVALLLLCGSQTLIPVFKPYWFKATNRPFSINSFPIFHGGKLTGYLFIFLFLFYIFTLSGGTSWRFSQFCDALVICQIVLVVCGYILNESRAARSRVGSSKLLRLI